MNDGRPSALEWVTGAAGLLLLVSLLLPWERRPAGRPPTTETLGGWASFGPLAAALVVVAAVPLWHLGRRLQARRGLRPLALLCAGAAGVSVVIAGLGSRLGVSSRPAAGLFTAMAAAAVIALGAAAQLWTVPGAGPPPDPGDRPA